MRTAELSVVPESFVCNANCPFCISKQNFDPCDKRTHISERALVRAIQYAKDCGAQTGIVTGKGEPLCMDPDLIDSVIRTLRDSFGRVDLHTNGLKLVEMEHADFVSYMDHLRSCGLTNLTLSIAHHHSRLHMESMGITKPVLEPLVRRILTYKNSHPLHVRFACVLAKEYVGTREQIERYLQFAHEWGADAVIFREMWVSGASPQAKWCRDNFVSKEVVRSLMFDNTQDFKPLMEHPWGWVYEYKGKVAVSTGVCDFHEDDFAKSLILLPDNHLYYLWSSPASRIW